MADDDGRPEDERAAAADADAADRAHGFARHERPEERADRQG
ncbi:hypothetical protein GA0115259_105999, partial [Streptomyces sp. MnatMP-M17]